MSFKMKGPSLYRNTKVTSSGYRSNSPDVNNKQNIIPGNTISMKEENGKPLEKGSIKGKGMTTGKTKVMKPGKDYKFPGDKAVLETPLKKKDCNCWDGYKRVPGTKPCAPGSCKKD